METIDNSNYTPKPYLIRSSYYNQAKHFHDNYINLGYNYKGNLFKNGTSPELWANPLQVALFAKLEAMITFLINNTKDIKKQFSIAHDKNSLNIN